MVGRLQPAEGAQVGPRAEALDAVQNMLAFSSW